MHTVSSRFHSLLLYIWSLEWTHVAKTILVLNDFPGIIMYDVCSMVIKELLFHSALLMTGVKFKKKKN